MCLYTMNTIQNSPNSFIDSPLTANGNISIYNINLKEAEAYKNIEEKMQHLNQKMERTQQKIQKYPDDSDFQEDLNALKMEYAQKQAELESLKQGVIDIIRYFAQIPPRTERARLAQQLVHAGKFKEARTILDVETITANLNKANEQETVGIQLQEQARREKSTIAHEFLIVARLTAIDFDLPNPFEATKKAFEQSLLVERNMENVFAYAHFLQEHHQFHQAQPLYEEVLKIRKALTAIAPLNYQQNIASVLNNLANVCLYRNKYGEAKAYYKEALTIRRQLVEANRLQYAPQLANTLSNLANMHANQKELQLAKPLYEEALSIYESLDSETYLPFVAMAQLHWGSLYASKYNLTKAEFFYEKALKLYQQLEAKDPQNYSAGVAITMNNLASLHENVPKKVTTNGFLQKALDIRRQLVKRNPHKHSSDLVLSLNNFGLFQKNQNNLVASAALYQEALTILRELAKDNPETYLPSIAMTLSNLAEVYRIQPTLSQSAEPLFLESYAIFLEFARRVPSIYFPNMCKVVHNLALLYSRHPLKAFQYHEMAMKSFKNLAKDNPLAYSVDMASAVHNMCSFYFDISPDREKSFGYAKEALFYALPFVEKSKIARQIVNNVLQILHHWNFNPDYWFIDIKQSIEYMCFAQKIQKRMDE
jgi:Tetratricopeptide repeat